MNTQSNQNTFQNGGVSFPEKSGIDTSTFVNPLEAARKQRLAVAGDALATAGVEVHGDNAGGNVRVP